MDGGDAPFLTKGMVCLGKKGCTMSQRIKKILAVQFRSDVSFLHERMCLYRAIFPHRVEITMVSSLDSEVDWKHPETLIRDFDGVILGGSGEFHFSGCSSRENERFFNAAITNTSPLVQYLIEEDFPTLGICFGHQMIAYALGVPVVHDPTQAKTAGSYMVNLAEEGKNDVLFSDIPGQFYAQYAHRESLGRLPDGCVLLASNGSRCKAAAIRHGKHVYGVQFHPELTRKDIAFRIRISGSEYAGEEMFVRETKETEKILENFVKKM